MTRIIMNGFNGSMGKVICKMVSKDKACEIVAGVDVTSTNATFPSFINIHDCDMPADVILDFSTASAVPTVIDYAVKKKLPIVICTTGLTDDILNQIEEASAHIAIFKSANMSLGINLIANLIKRAVALLDESNFDIEIIEKHHNQKIDAPSGTALLLANSLNEEMNGKYHYVHDRSQTREKRETDEIGFHAIRGGTIVGEHSVLFAGKDEIIEFKHSALSKDVFAVGAVRAAKFMPHKPAGMYNMQDLIDFHDGTNKE